MTARGSCLGALAGLLLLGAAPATAAPAVVAADAVFDRVDATIAAGRYDIAQDLLARNAAALPAARLALARAEIALATGATDEAVGGFRALAGDPVLAARAQLGLGLALLRSGETAAAVKALDAALVADPGSSRAWIARGVAAEAARAWETADAAYARALAIDPASASIPANRGYSLLLRGRLVESAAESRRALALDPRLATAVTNLRLAQAMQGNYTAAGSKPVAASDLNTIGFAAMARGDYAVAETFFTRAMAENPRFDRVAWDNLVYLKQLVHPAARPGDAR